MIKKVKKGNTIIDIIIAIMFISIVLLSCYSLTTSAINKRQQVKLQTQATNIAENILNRTLAKGVYHIQSEPAIDSSTLTRINNIIADSRLNVTQKNKQISELGGLLPVDSEKDAPFLNLNDTYQNKFFYQLIVEDYVKETGVDGLGNKIYLKDPSLKKITVNVFYVARVNKFEKNQSSLEEEYKVVSLSTYKASREYGTKR